MSCSSGSCPGECDASKFQNFKAHEIPSSYVLGLSLPI